MSGASVYNTFRDYSPDIGRYIESDPIGLEGGTNTYTYVYDPLTQIDPAGLMGRAPGSSPSQIWNNIGAACDCQGGFSQAWWNNFTNVMGTVPGFLAPTGMGFFGAKSFANSVGGQTWGQWWKMPNWYVPKMPMPPVGPPIITSIVKFGAYGAAFTAGVAIGSVISTVTQCNCPAPQAQCPAD